MNSKYTYALQPLDRVGDFACQHSAVPVDGFRQPGVERRRCAEAELPLGAADVEAAARLSVRLGRVPDDAALKADITGKKYLSAIENDNNQALGLSLPGTPSYFFNGHSLQASDLAGLLKEAQPYLNK